MKFGIFGLAFGLLLTPIASQAQDTVKEKWVIDIILPFEENTGWCLRRLSDAGFVRVIEGRIVGKYFEIALPQGGGAWQRMPIAENGDIDHKGRHGGERFHWVGNVNTRKIRAINIDMGCKSDYVARK